MEATGAGTYTLRTLRNILALTYSEVNTFLTIDASVIYGAVFTFVPKIKMATLFQLRAC